MPLLETEAIVLRTYRLGEADKITSLFTRQIGRVRAVAGGSQRPKSRYGGALESLSYIRLWLYERENRDLLRMNSAELIESFFDMQKDYRIHLAGQYLAEALERVLPERQINERVFRLVLVVLRALKQSREINRPLLYFNYWLLRLEGFLPAFEKCFSCGQAFGQQTAYYGRGLQGLVCSACRTGEGRRPFAPRGLSMLRVARETALDRWISDEREPAGASEARCLLEELLESHLEKKLVTRTLLADDMLDS